MSVETRQTRVWEDSEFMPRNFNYERIQEFHLRKHALIWVYNFRQKIHKARKLEYIHEQHVLENQKKIESAKLVFTPRNLD